MKDNPTQPELRHTQPYTTETDVYNTNIQERDKIRKIQSSPSKKRNRYIPQKFKEIPLGEYKECKRCGREFEVKKNRKYCQNCSPIAFLENLKRSQQKYFQTPKGKKALAKSWKKYNKKLKGEKGK